MGVRRSASCSAMSAAYLRASMTRLLDRAVLKCPTCTARLVAQQQVYRGVIDASVWPQQGRRGAVPEMPASLCQLQSGIKYSWYSASDMHSRHIRSWAAQSAVTWPL